MIKAEKIKSMSIKKVLLSLIPILSLFLCWQILVHFGFINIGLFPAPSKIFSNLYAMICQDINGQSMLLGHLIVSLKRLFVAAIAGTLIGILVGIFMGLNPLIYRLLHPIISLVMPIPGIAMAPLFIVWKGFGDITIISIGALTTIFHIAYNTLIGVQSIDRQLVRAAEIMGANRFAIVTEVYIPWGAVYLFTGVKLGLARCWEIGDRCRAHCGQQLGVGIYDLGCCRTSQRKDCIWWYHSARPPLYFYREVAHSFLRKSDHRKMGNDKRLILTDTAI